MATDQVGAIIESGPSDWQIVQRDANGHGVMPVAGKWVGDAPGNVQVRLVREDSGQAVTAGLDWHDAKTNADGTWALKLQRIPAGGLYRLETRYRQKINKDGEWSPRGDVRHFLGVGDLWVIAGQSNSAGYGRGPVFDAPELGVHVLRNSEQWALATHPLNESTDTRHAVNREAANSGHSPYLRFGKRLQAASGVPIGLIQTSLGGSPLQQWNPTEPGTPSLYDNMLHCVALAGGRARGVLWYQGESDTSPEASVTYLSRFTKTVTSWRKALKNPDLLVLTVQLNRCFFASGEEGDRGWSTVREAQRQAARTIPGVTISPTFDLTLSDMIHISSEGNLVLGDRMAQCALTQLGVADAAYLAPDVEKAQLVERGKAIRLTFSNVTSRLGCNDVAANCFRVEDGEGVRAIAGLEYDSANSITLRLEIAVSGPVAVHGAWGVNPKQAPMDMERQMPILGFSVGI